MTDDRDTFTRTRTMNRRFSCAESKSMEGPSAPMLAGRFAIIEPLGLGGMGVVYRALDQVLDREVAIKVLHSHRAAHARSRARLIREARTMARLSHRNVVQVYDVGECGDQVFVVMEYIRGCTLAQWIARHKADGIATWLEVLTLFCGAIQGLMAIHDAGIVHRDFKPSNVLVSDDGRVCVADFGLACGLPGGDPEAALSGAGSRAEDGDESADRGVEEVGRRGCAAMYHSLISGLSGPMTATGAVTGTPAYMSPEQFAGQSTDHRSDQFSLCVALHEALHGSRPFSGRSLDELMARVQAGEIDRAPSGRAIPRWLRDIVSRGLHPDPAGRWPSLPALLAEIARNQGEDHAQTRSPWADSVAVEQTGVRRPGDPEAARLDEPIDGRSRPRHPWSGSVSSSDPGLLGTAMKRILHVLPSPIMPQLPPYHGPRAGHAIALS